ncbi:MAG TPA: hypothetical protein VIW19_12725 [Gaiellaceae bacterium]|jgi:hypothetical protein
MVRGLCGHILGLAAVLSAAALLGVALLNGPTAAQAAAGGYTFAGGNARERAVVHAALGASSFDWSLVPAHVTIHITRGGNSYSTRGEIWLSATLLSGGRAAWGVVQHEYAHQVDFFLFDAKVRASLNRALGGTTWWPDRAGEHFRHSQFGAERFASTLAWAYWPSRQNTLFRYAHDEATALPPARFRKMLSDLVASL